MSDADVSVSGKTTLEQGLRKALLTPAYAMSLILWTCLRR